MQKLILIPFFLALISCTTTISLNTSPEIDLLYSFPSSDTIELTLQFFTQGYIAIGFGTTMANSQLYIASKASSGDFTVVSAHVPGHTVPTPDPVQNLQFVSGTRDSSKTVVTFRRKLNTDNGQDVTIVTGTPIDLVWAYGSDDTLKHHVAHGGQKVTFSANCMNRFQKLILSLREEAV